MKSILLPFFTITLFLASCGQNNIDADNEVNINIETRSNYECIENVTCDLDYDFPIKKSGAYNCFLVTFDESLNLAEIHCLKHAYFSCFPHLRLSLLQTDDAYSEMWCYPIGKPLNGLSTTIDSDPRVDDGD